MQVGAVMTTSLVTVESGATVQEAIERMMEAHVGSVAVCEGSTLVGIFTERDVLRLAAERSDLRTTPVRDAMTRRLVTATADVAIVDAAHLMGEHRIRHLPVVEGDALVGMVGIRDVLRTLVERVWSDHDAGARETAGELLSRTP
jgi:CBS domain-containing protein